MQPAYYENLEEIQNKYWSMLDDAVTNRSSSFRIPVFMCAQQDEIDGRIVVLRKSDRALSDFLKTTILPSISSCWAHIKTGILKDDDLLVTASSSIDQYLF